MRSQDKPYGLLRSFFLTDFVLRILAKLAKFMAGALLEPFSDRFLEEEFCEHSPPCLQPPTLQAVAANVPTASAVLTQKGNLPQVSYAIHPRSAWNKNSTTFALTEFGEGRIEEGRGILRGVPAVFSLYSPNCSEIRIFQRLTDKLQSSLFGGCADLR